MLAALPTVCPALCAPDATALRASSTRPLPFDRPAELRLPAEARLPFELRELLRRLFEALVRLRLGELRLAVRVAGFLRVEAVPREELCAPRVDVLRAVDDCLR